MFVPSRSFFSFRNVLSLGLFPRANFPYFRLSCTSVLKYPNSSVFNLGKLNKKLIWETWLSDVPNLFSLSFGHSMARLHEVGQTSIRDLQDNVSVVVVSKSSKTSNYVVMARKKMQYGIQIQRTRYFHNDVIIPEFLMHIDFLGIILVVGDFLKIWETSVCTPSYFSISSSFNQTLL